jgi:hypothetical protein
MQKYLKHVVMAVKFRVLLSLFAAINFSLCKPTPEIELEEKIIHSLMYRKYWEAEIACHNEYNEQDKINRQIAKTKPKGFYSSIIRDKTLKVKERNEKLKQNGFYVSAKYDSLLHISSIRFHEWFDSFPELLTLLKKDPKKGTQVLINAHRIMSKQYYGY